MTRQEFIEKMRELASGNDYTAAQWCRWLEQHGISYQSMYAAFYGVNQLSPGRRGRKYSNRRKAAHRY